MKFSLNWIKDLAPITLGAQDVADKLTQMGIEVEGIHRCGQNIKGIVTGKIQAIHPHPNADKLRITEFFDGSTTHQIVTGAQNVQVGDIVPASLPGAVIANGMSIKPSALRGVDSFGMLCSQVELGIAEASEGIWILPADTALGLDVVSAFELQDDILDLAILPNRGDCQSILGIARELSPTSLNLDPGATHPTPLMITIRLTRCGITPAKTLPEQIAQYVLHELGQPLEVTLTPTKIQLSAPQLDPIAVRKSKPKMAQESLVRYEKGIDPNVAPVALTRAAALIAALTPNQSIEIQDSAPLQLPEKWIPYSADAINRLLGLSLDKTVIDGILEQLGFTSINSQAKVPSWRYYDIQEWPCLAEEIARIHGLDQIPTSLPDNALGVEPNTALYTLTQKLEALLPTLGATQLCTLPMIPPQHLQNPDAALIIQNPISAEESAMRDSLLASALPIVSHNLRHGASYFDGFEIAKIYHKSGDNIQEETQLIIVTTSGPQQAPYTGPEIAQNKLHFSHLKGRVETLLELTRSIQVSFNKSEDPRMHPVQSAQILSGKTLIGTLGLLHPQTSQKFDIDVPVGVIILNLSTIVTLPSKGLKYQPFSKFPIIERDIALLAPRDLSFERIVQTLQKNKPKLLKNVQLFDLYSDDKLGPDKKSLAIRLQYQDPDTTLTDDVINATHQELVQKLTLTLPVSIR